MRNARDVVPYYMVAEMKFVYVWIPWGCYVPEKSFGGMRQAGRTLGIDGKQINEHFARKGYYSCDEGTLVKVDHIKNDKRDNKNLLKK
jgi:hypothetical protein